MRQAGGDCRIRMGREARFYMNTHVSHTGTSLSIYYRSIYTGYAHRWDLQVFKAHHEDYLLSLTVKFNFFLISISKRDGAMNLLLSFLKLSERVISQCSFSLQQILCLLCLDSCYLHARLGPSRNFLLCRRLPFTSRKHFFRVLSLRLNLVRLSYSRVGLAGLTSNSIL